MGTISCWPANYFCVFLFSIAVVLYLYTMQMTVTQIGKQVKQQHLDSKKLKIKRINKFDYLSDVSVKPKTVYPSVLIK
uniref:ATP synthase F0 subunit 8 n=1 Tax=Ditylenchus dipsaci TaxID=166011 RepID=A0A915ESX0_9BILA